MQQAPATEAAVAAAVGPAVETLAAEAAAGAPVAWALDERADLGVLLVHGIGEQAQGETLTQGTEPILEWVGSWLGRELPGHSVIAATPMQASLRPPLLDSKTPAHAQVLVGRRIGDDAQGQDWLFAEAHWATQVLPPALAEFTAWLLTRGAWMLLFQLDQWWLAGRPLWRQLLLGPLVLLAWMLLSMLVNLLLLAIALLGLLPIGRVRALAYGLLKGLAGVIGDAYVLIRHPLQRAAFEDATLRALHWLRSRCKRVAVVAHSQGASIAHGALQRPDAPQADLLVTVGSGIAKLNALRWFERQATLDRAAAFLAPPLLLAAALVWLRTQQLGLADQEAANLGAAALGLVGLGLLYVTWRRCRDVMARLRSSSAALLLGDEQPALQWMDVAGSHDPVSAGTLQRYFDLPGLEAETVPVLRSWFGDHTHYWDARASFVPLLVRRLATCAGAQFLGLDPADRRFAVARQRHDRDLRVLRWATRLDWAALLLAVVVAADRWQAQVAHWRMVLAGGAGRRGPMAFIDAAAKQAEDMVGWTAELLSLQANQAGIAQGVNWASAALLLVVLLLLWQRVAFALWQTWSDNNIEAAWQPARDPRALSLRQRSEALTGEALIDGSMACLLLLPFMLSVLWALGPAQWWTEAQAYTILNWSVVGLLVVAFVFSQISDLAGEVDNWRGGRAGLIRRLVALSQSAPGQWLRRLWRR